MSAATDTEIQKALYGRKKGGRIRVKEDPALRSADGIVFDSRHEMHVYLQFKSLLKCGTFTEMLMQVKYQIHVMSPQGLPIPVFYWLADFVIKDRDGKQHVYDAKGHRTDVYKLKKKCVEAEYNIRIVEI